MIKEYYTSRQFKSGSEGLRRIGLRRKKPQNRFVVFGAHSTGAMDPEAQADNL